MSFVEEDRLKPSQLILIKLEGKDEQKKKRKEKTDPAAEGEDLFRYTVEVGKLIGHFLSLEA